MEAKMNSYMGRGHSDYLYAKAGMSVGEEYGDFYFDARYPGDNFVAVSREDALECLEMTEQVEEAVVELLLQEEQKREDKKKKIQGLETFEM